MDPYESQEAERRLAFLELLLTAQERRHEVVDAVWASADRDEAAERLRSLSTSPTTSRPSWSSTCRWRGSPGTNETRSRVR